MKIQFNLKKLKKRQVLSTTELNCLKGGRIRFKTKSGSIPPVIDIKMK